MAHTVHIESDERGFYLDIEGEIFYLADPEQLYDQARARILPWLMERDEAAAEYKTQFRSVVFEPDDDGGYDLSDPKHPTWADRMAAVSDDRDAFDYFSEEDR